MNEQLLNFNVSWLHSLFLSVMGWNSSALILDINIENQVSGLSTGQVFRALKKLC